MCCDGFRRLMRMMEDLYIVLKGRGRVRLLKRQCHYQHLLMNSGIQLPEDLLFQMVMKQSQHGTKFWIHPCSKISLFCLIKNGTLISQNLLLAPELELVCTIYVPFFYVSLFPKYPSISITWLYSMPLNQLYMSKVAFGM